MNYNNSYNAIMEINMSKFNIKGAIFDLDGTLLNSMDYWASVGEEFLSLSGIEPPAGSSRLFLENGIKGAHKIWQETLGLAKSFEQTYSEIYALMEKKYLSVVNIKDGAREMLEDLRERGVKMCIASATDHYLVEKILKRLCLDHLFSKILTCSEVGAGKNKPLIYELALEHLGTPRDETYVFEDAYYALTTAHENGFHTIGVYDKNVFVPEAQILPLCDFYLDKDSKYKLPF